MKKILTIIGVGMLALFCGVWGAYARTVLDVFMSGTTQIQLIDSITRMDMADYYRSGLKYTSQNVVSEPVRIIDITADTMAMRFTVAPDVESELALLTDGRADTVVMYVTTYRLPQRDSRIAFRDMDGKLLSARHILPEAKLNDWLTAEGVRNRGEVEARLPFLCAVARYDTASRILTLTGTMDEFFADGSDRQMLQRYLRPELTYRWNGKKFVRQKEK